MHIKFLKHGKGSGDLAAAYLLGERDARGRVRDHVSVRRGDPVQVAAVADTCGRACARWTPWRGRRR